MHPALAAIAVALATWESWWWYARRIAEAPEELVALGVVIAAGAIVPALRLRRAAEGVRLGATALLGLAALLLLHAASHGLLPPIVRATAAMAATVACGCAALAGRWPPVALWAAVALALPVLPSLQYTLGYPMRIVSAALTALLLQMQGLAVESQGTLLVWRGELIQFDAPCSGVRMLWAGLLLALLGCVALRLDLLRMLLAVAAALVLTLLANVLRATSLFVIEAGLVAQPPAWWHEGIGLVAFAGAGAAILLLLRRLEAS
jgi:exosortase/archaeosortase family protein